MAMRVAHIITGLDRGGAESSLSRLITSSHQQISQIVISLMDHGVYGEKIVSTGVPLYTLDMKRGRPTINGLCNLLRLLKRIRPNVVQTWMYHGDLIGGVISRLAGFQNIAWGIRHTNLDPNITSFSTRIVAKLCAKLSGIIPKVIISNSERAISVHKSIGYCEDKFVLIHNGYNFDELRPSVHLRDKMRAELGLSSDTVVLGMMARYNPQKDHDNLFKALHELKRRCINFICLLAGPDIVMDNIDLVERIKSLDLQPKIRLLGVIQDVSRFMNAIDLYVLSSLGEGFPNVVAEAMACGTPCVVTDVGEAARIIGDNGWIIPPHDSMALALGIEKAIIEMEDIYLWTSRKLSCRVHVNEHFNIHKMVNEYINIWQRISSAPLN